MWKTKFDLSPFPMESCMMRNMGAEMWEHGIKKCPPGMAFAADQLFMRGTSRDKWREDCCRDSPIFFEKNEMPGLLTFLSLATYKSQSSFAIT